MAHYRHRDEGHSTRPGDLACYQVARLIHSPSASVLAIAALASFFTVELSHCQGACARFARSGGSPHHRPRDQSGAGIAPLASFVTSSRALTCST